MKYSTSASLVLAASASAATLPRDTCSFTLTASGSQSGIVGQLSDGQNRIGGGHPTANFTINNGQITDSEGRGCVLTDSAYQFQCDSGATPTGGFSIGSSGTFAHDNSTVFYACPAADTEYNIYTTPVAGQDKCVQVGLTASGCYAPASTPSAQVPTVTATAPGKTILETTTQEETAPAQTVVQTMTEKETAPAQTIVQTKTEEETAPAQTIVQTKTEEETAPAQTVVQTVVQTKTQEETAPAQTIVQTVVQTVTQEQTAPAQTIYMTQTQEETAPAQTVYVTQTKEETAPAQTIYMTQTQEETAPAQTVYITQTQEQTAAPSTITITETAQSSCPAPQTITQQASCSAQTVYVTSVVSASQATTPVQPTTVYTQTQKTTATQTLSTSTQKVSQSATIPASSKTAASSTPSASSSSCPTNLDGAYQYPHLIVPVSSASPDTAYGTSYNGVVNETVSTIFNFDIPSSYTGTCSLVFLFPTQDQLETSSYTFSGDGVVDISQLSTIATQATTYNSVGSVEKDFGDFTVTPGSWTSVSTFACPAGETVSYEMKNAGSTDLWYFEDWNPSPIGLFITTC